MSFPSDVRRGYMIVPAVSELSVMIISWFIKVLDPSEIIRRTNIPLLIAVALLHPKCIAASKVAILLKSNLLLI